MRALRLLSFLIPTLLIFYGSHFAQAAPAETLSPTSGPPTTNVTVKGTGFPPNELVDLFFDTDDLVLGVTNAAGAFTQTLKVPRSAEPGVHWITARSRAGGAAQKSFTVRTNWTQFRYGLKHQGCNPYENVLSPANVAGLNEAWSYTTGNEIFSSPAVANGVVYVGSSDGKLYALNASTGAFKWNYTTSNWIVSSPAVANGVVYVGSYDHNLYALNASTGAFKWDYTTGGSIVSAPAVANGVAYVGSYDKNLYGLDASTGNLLWSSTTGDAIESSPAIVDGKVYVGSRNHALYAYSLDPGLVYLVLFRRPDPASLVPDYRLRPEKGQAASKPAEHPE
jgi:outer membrane protein assembly factor BamB